MAIETSANLCERFGVTRSTVCNWVLHGWLTPLIRSKRFFFFDGADVERFQRDIWVNLKSARRSKVK